MTPPKTSSKSRVRGRLESLHNPLARSDSVMDLLIGSTSISTTSALLASPLDPAMKSTTGQFALYPQVFRPFMGASSTPDTFTFIGRIRLLYLQVKFNCVGAQANTLVAADLFSRIRIVVIWTRSPYQASVNFNAITIDTHADLRDGVVLFDQTVNLPSQAFDSNDYNVPGCRTLRKTIFLNQDLEVFSTANGDDWDTRQGNLRIYAVSDSSVVPHPSVSGSTRVIYKILN